MMMKCHICGLNITRTKSLSWDILCCFCFSWRELILDKMWRKADKQARFVQQVAGQRVHNPVI